MSCQRIAVLWSVGLSCVGLAWGLAQNATAAEPSAQSLRQGLTFYASFDKSPDGDFARGDRRIHSSPTFDEIAKGEPGFHTKEMTVLVPSAGISGGGALKFTSAQSPVVYFLADKNLNYRAKDWSGSVSFWLRVDPARELAPGYCDPIQITTRAWNDGAFFVDFDKDTTPRDIRLGAYSDLAVWNPANRPYEQIPVAELPLAPVKSPPFSAQAWTHLLFTWDHFNSDAPTGVATFYVNGEKRGEISPRQQHFSWKSGETPRIFLGVYYIGMLDEVACFDRALTPVEVAAVHALQGSLKPAK